MHTTDIAPSLRSVLSILSLRPSISVPPWGLTVPHPNPRTLSGTYTTLSAPPPPPKTETHCPMSSIILHPSPNLSVTEPEFLSLNPSLNTSFIPYPNTEPPPISDPIPSLAPSPNVPLATTPIIRPLPKPKCHPTLTPLHPSLHS